MTTNCKKIVYFDNNGTTLICKKAKDVLVNQISCYNVSTDSKIVKPIKLLMTNSIDQILNHCNVSTASHTVLFTSGGTESNCLIIRMITKAYKKKLQEKHSELLPHIIISAVEHASIIECTNDLKESNEIDLTIVSPTIYGNILPKTVEDAIKPNTCLISIMYANNEIPVINNIREIGSIAHEHNIPLHSDCVQVFGKYPIDLKKSNIDTLSASAHKFYGPKGIGILIIKNELIDGYKLKAEINGTQQYGLRGGTENIPGIASMTMALKAVFEKRKEKNEKLTALRERLLKGLSERYTFNDYVNYLYPDDDKGLSKSGKLSKQNIDNAKEDIELISLGPPINKSAFILLNTVLLSVAKNRGKPFCNVELKKFLDQKNFIVSIGSACNTNSEKSSHVLSAIGAPSVIKRGVIRISFGDLNTVGEVDKFIKVFCDGIQKQSGDLEGLNRD